VLPRLAEIAEDFKSACPKDIDAMSCDAMLDTAAHLEFFLLDPIFTELLDLTEPGSNNDHRTAYGAHVEKLARALEAHYSRGDLAAFLARALLRSWENQYALSMLATHDPLTSLLNRRGFQHQLSKWMNWAQRYDRPLGVILADIDDFKSVNDRFGHAAGDEALLKVSQAIASGIRNSDLAARYGGDEFAIIAPETDVEHLPAVMDRMLDTIRGLDVSVNGQRVSVTASAGGIIVPGKQPDPHSTDEVLAAADQALYRAKDAGKNRSFVGAKLART
jgi:diguanylate cyclase (GGDEF)-like protein